MAWIQTIPLQPGDDELQDLYAQVLDPATGQLDHIMQIHGLHPAGLRAHFDLYRAVMAGTPGLRQVDREMVAGVPAHGDRVAATPHAVAGRRPAAEVDPVDVVEVDDARGVADLAAHRRRFRAAEVEKRGAGRIGRKE